MKTIKKLKEKYTYYAKRYFRDGLIALLNRLKYEFKKPLTMDVWEVIFTDDMDWDICSRQVRCLNSGSLVNSIYKGYPEIRHISRTRDLLRLLWAYMTRA